MQMAGIGRGSPPPHVKASGKSPPPAPEDNDGLLARCERAQHRGWWDVGQVVVAAVAAEHRGAVQLLVRQRRDRLGPAELARRGGPGVGAGGELEGGAERREVLVGADDEAALAVELGVVAVAFWWAEPADRVGVGEVAVVAERRGGRVVDVELDVARIA